MYLYITYILITKYFKHTYIDYTIEANVKKATIILSTELYSPRVPELPRVFQRP